MVKLSDEKMLGYCGTNNQLKGREKRWRICANSMIMAARRRIASCESVAQKKRMVNYVSNAVAAANSLTSHNC